MLSRRFWEFNPTTNEWTWMVGSKFCADIGAGYTGGYSNVGVPAIQNKPSSVLNATSWTDSSGKLWHFGVSVRIQRELATR